MDKLDKIVSMSAYRSAFFPSKEAKKKKSVDDVTALEIVAKKRQNDLEQFKQQFGGAFLQTGATAERRAWFAQELERRTTELRDTEKKTLEQKEKRCLVPSNVF